MTLSRRHIDLIFQLGKGSFGEGGTDTLTLKGLRVSASIAKAGGVSMTELRLRVYGMPLDAMKKLAILGKPLTDARRNTIVVSAGDEEKGMSVVFAGIITQAWIDARSAPQIVFVVTAYTGVMDALKPIPPTSFKGSVDSATIVAGIIAQMAPDGSPSATGGMTLENGGVSVQIASPYLAGTALDQLQRIARDGNFNCLIEGNTVAIWPVGGARKGEKVLVSPETGMVGYPAYTDNGIQIVTLFNPSISYGIPIKVESLVLEATPAEGVWKPYSVSHDLESETPGGKWFTTVECDLMGAETVGR